MISPTEESKADYRGLPTSICMCGSMFFNVQCKIDQNSYELEFYTTEAVCSNCGALVTIATPADL